MEGGSEAQSALAAKALGSVVRGTPALQEVLLDAGGADVLIRHLDAQETAQADKETGEHCPSCMVDISLQTSILTVVQHPCKSYSRQYKNTLQRSATEV